MARKEGDRVAEGFGSAWGTISAVKEVAPGIFEYGIVWDDGDYEGETWTESDLEPLPEGD